MMITYQYQPTRYLIQEKRLSLNNKIIITDYLGNVHYKAHSRFFSMGDKISLYDARGNKLMKIRQDKLHLHLTYRIFSTQSNVEYEIASIIRTGPLWQHKLHISSSNGEYILKRNGGVSANEYTLTKNGDIVVIATKDVSPTKTLYWVDIVNNDEEDHALLLAMMIVLSCAQRLPGNPMAKPPRVSNSKSVV